MPPQAKAQGEGGRPSASPQDAVAARERELIRRIRGGERELFSQLIRPYERRMYVTAMAILQSESDAQDVAQDSILKAFTHLWQFREESRFSTWLTRITINEARMRRRKEHREIMKPFHELENQNDDAEYVPRDFTDWREIPSEALERSEIREQLVKALGLIAEKYREVFILRDVQQLSVEETAEVIGEKPGTVRTRLLRARLMLRDLLAPGLGGSWLSRLPFEKGDKPWT